MSTNKLISKIFLPKHCLKAQAGYIVGWNVRSFVTCVATIISDIELHELDRVLSSLSEHEEIRNSPCGPPVVLGEWLVNESPESSKSEEDDNSDIKILKSNKVNEESIWIMMDRDPAPTLKEIYCYGYRYQTSAQIVVYSQTTPQHFYWPEPIHLDLKSHKNEEELTELEEALQQVNIASSVERLLFREIRKTAFEPMTHGLLRYWLLSTSIMYFIMIYTPIASQILHFVNYKIPFVNKSLAELSVTGRHMDSRIRLVVQWKSKFQKLHTEWNRNTPESRSNYLNFYNELWLIVNDLFFGIIVGTLLLYNRDFILTNVDKANHFLTNNILKALIAWLMGWPAGFKLNDELDEFLGVVFMFYIDRWTEVLMWFQPFQPLIVSFVASTGFVGGLSLIIALGIDILNFFTFHIYCFYTASARIYLLQLNILSSLWKLFRGKKYNPLKDRIDSCDFNIDQLLLGTLLFTLFFFLLPTTGIYYVFFTLVRIFLTSLKCVLVFVMDLLEHFPLYPVVIYFVDNAFLPGGVWLEVCNSSFAPLEEEEDTGIIGNVLKLLVMDSPEVKPMKGGTKTAQRKQHAYLVLKNRRLAFGTLFVHVLKCVEPLFKGSTWKKLFT